MQWFLDLLQDTWEFLIGLAMVAATLIGILLGSAWALMVTLGIVHHDVHAAVPALSFWQTIATAWLIFLVGAIFNATNFAGGNS